jgi:hypothetical protein
MKRIRDLGVVADSHDERRLGQPEEADARRGGIGFLHKPFDLRELDRLVARAIASTDRGWSDAAGRSLRRDGSVLGPWTVTPVNNSFNDAAGVSAHRCRAMSPRAVMIRCGASSISSLVTFACLSLGRDERRECYIDSWRSVVTLVRSNCHAMKQ